MMQFGNLEMWELLEKVPASLDKDTQKSRYPKDFPVQNNR